MFQKEEIGEGSTQTSNTTPAKRFAKFKLDSSSSDDEMSQISEAGSVCTPSSDTEMTDSNTGSEVEERREVIDTDGKPPFKIGLSYNKVNKHDAAGEVALEQIELLEVGDAASKTRCADLKKRGAKTAEQGPNIVEPTLSSPVGLFGFEKYNNVTFETVKVKKVPEQSEQQQKKSKHVGTSHSEC